MANYAGLSYGNEVYCDIGILSILDQTTGAITGTGKCFQAYNGGGGGAIGGDFTVNGEYIQIGAAQTVDVIIDTITFDGAVPEGLCIVCTCHDCNNPDGNAARAVTWPAGTGTTETLINPSSPYTLIGSGFLNS